MISSCHLIRGQPVQGLLFSTAIVWQDRRTADFCDQMKQVGGSLVIQDKTGLIIDVYFSATRIRWILDNVNGALKMEGEIE
jgi:glycerol kinase